MLVFVLLVSLGSAAFFQLQSRQYPNRCAAETQQDTAVFNLCSWQDDQIISVTDLVLLSGDRLTRITFSSGRCLHGDGTLDACFSAPVFQVSVNGQISKGSLCLTAPTLDLQPCVSKSLRQQWKLQESAPLPLVPSQEAIEVTESPPQITTLTPSESPSFAPTFLPTSSLTSSPTSRFLPSSKLITTSRPSVRPSLPPSVLPSPSFRPSTQEARLSSFSQASKIGMIPFPTLAPTAPTKISTSKPSPFPTSLPSSPTPFPTIQPTPLPTPRPSPRPTPLPTLSPTPLPSSEPTPRHTSRPTSRPTSFPSPRPTFFPTPSPSPFPTPFPTPRPTPFPTPKPTSFPTPYPTRKPTPFPTPFPTPRPSKSPTNLPTRFPSRFPTYRPTKFPTLYPTPKPTSFPTLKPTTKRPTPQPSRAPTIPVAFRSLDLSSSATTAKENPFPLVSTRSFTLPLSLATFSSLNSSASLLSFSPDFSSSFATLPQPKFASSSSKSSDVELEQPQTDLFDPSQLRSYNLEYDPVVWGAQNVFAEKYTPCSVVALYNTKDARRYEGAGCRYKGGAGSLRVCFDPDTGKRNAECRKLSLKLDADTFAQAGVKQSFFGLKKLVFNGMGVDDSLVSERLVYSLFQAVGSVSSRAVHAQIFVNGVFDGIYLMVEEVDTQFIKYRFGAEKGGLYEDAWLRSENRSFFEECHQDGAKNEDLFLEITRAVKRTDQLGSKALMEKYFDSNSVVDVTAVDMLVGSSDDWRQRHNFFWYVRPTRQLVLVPWDYDRLNDEQGGRKWAETWYQIFSAGDSRCGPALSAEQRTQTLMTQQKLPESQRWYWLCVQKQLPDEITIPIQCDAFTHVISWALYPRIQARIVEIGKIATYEWLSQRMQSFVDQISGAVNKDNDRLKGWEWKKALDALLLHFLQMRRKLGVILPSEIRLLNQAIALKGIPSAAFGINVGLPLSNGLTNMGFQPRNTSVFAPFVSLPLPLPSFSAPSNGLFRSG